MNNGSVTSLQYKADSTDSLHSYVIKTEHIHWPHNFYENGRELKIIGLAANGKLSVTYFHICHSKRSL